MKEFGLSDRELFEEQEILLGNAFPLEFPAQAFEVVFFPEGHLCGSKRTGNLVFDVGSRTEIMGIGPQYISIERIVVCMDQTTTGHGLQKRWIGSPNGVTMEI